MWRFVHAMCMMKSRALHVKQQSVNLFQRFLGESVLYMAVHKHSAQAVVRPRFTDYDVSSIP